MKTLLVELFTEELPPKVLKRLGAAFGASLQASLAKLDFLGPDSTLTTYASPRRLAVQLSAVRAQSPDSDETVKLMPVAVALDADGRPTVALSKKLAALGIDADQVAHFTRRVDGKAETLFYTRRVAGGALQAALDGALQVAIETLPIPKVMRYQLDAGTARERDVRFVRPAHRLMALLGADIVPVSALGLTAGRATLGHRFLGKGEVTVMEADDYARALHEDGKVIASFEERREAIREALLRAAGDDDVIMPEALLDEVTALVEWPVVHAAHFDAGFLAVPQECLILTMQQNQKYFALTDAAGKMRNRFLLVSNIETDDPSAIIGGNERVLRARLSDARFFFEQDQKRTLESRLPGLASVVYHNKLGSQLERVARVEMLAARIAHLLGSDAAGAERAERAARLAKTDLLTDMVGEFPELQGLMGRYYALHDGEHAEVAAAIEEHYHPRFAGDSVPQTGAGTCVALADKLETLAGMFGIGNQPTGDKDPFALRRHALGVLRILIEQQLPLRLTELVHAAFVAFAHVGAVNSAAATDLELFLYDRLRGLLKDLGYGSAEVEAVVSLLPERIDLAPRQLAAVRAFLALPEAASLAAANKRIGNILKKASDEPAPLRDELLVEPAEKALADAMAAVRPQADALYATGDYTGMLSSLAGLRAPVDAFFNDVMVMAEDVQVRANRIALLRELHALMNRVADLSKLAS